MSRAKMVCALMWVAVCIAVGWYVTPPWMSVRVSWDVIPNQCMIVLLASWLLSVWMSVPVSGAAGGITLRRYAVTFVLIATPVTYTLQAMLVQGWFGPAVYAVNKNEADFLENVRQRGVRPTEITGIVTRVHNVCVERRTSHDNISVSPWLVVVGRESDDQLAHLCIEVQLAPTKALADLLSPSVTRSGKNLNPYIQPVLEKYAVLAANTAEEVCLEGNREVNLGNLLGCMTRVSNVRTQNEPQFARIVNQVQFKSVKIRSEYVE